MKVPTRPHIWLLIAAALVAGSLTYEHHYSPTVAASAIGETVAAIRKNVGSLSSQRHIMATNVVSKSLSDQHNDPKREQAAPIKQNTAHVTPSGHKSKVSHHHKSKVSHHHHHHSGGHSTHHCGGHGGSHAPDHSSGHYHPRC
jgi:hypothetical protein